MLLSSPKARLITFSKTRLIKFYLYSKLMTDPIFPLPFSPRHKACRNYGIVYQVCLELGE